MQIVQNGDTEGVAVFVPWDPQQVKVAVHIAGIKPKRKSSEAQLENLVLGLRFRFKGRAGTEGLYRPKNERSSVRRYRRPR
jgi:hypothetical protein